MKFIAVCSAVAATAAAIAYSQPPRIDAEGRRPPRPPRDPYLQLFDLDGDGEISAKEIDNAASVLRKLDRDKDGVITREELPRPPRPGDERQDGPPRRGKKNNREQIEKGTENVPDGTVIFRGGYQTDRRDNGRPVSLIAAALGVKSEVFRDAFSRVQPARGGDPTPERARANKKVLMDALGKHGVTNDQLDTVSNYYRYNGAKGEVWRRTPARATAIIENGNVTGFRITEPGSGYTTAPTVAVAGHFNVRVEATLAFSKDFKKNGSIAKLTIMK